MLLNSRRIVAVLNDLSVGNNTPETRDMSKRKKLIRKLEPEDNNISADGQPQCLRRNLKVRGKKKYRQLINQMSSTAARCS
jgi:hypothetical protein